ncbi:MAG: efflux RND transporter periplasmic adaptor subunit [Spirochaetia bacterium]
MTAGDRIRTITLSACFLSLLLLNQGCADRNEQPGAYETQVRKKIRVVHSCLQTVRPFLETFGTLVYHSKADIYPGIDGTIESVPVEEGQRVSKGQALALFSKERLLTNHEQIEAEVASKQALLSLAEERLLEGKKAVEAKILEIQKAKADLAQREAEYNNILKIYSNKKRVHEAGGISTGELETLRTRLVAAQMELVRAEKNLEIQQIGFRKEDILAAGLKVPEEDLQRQMVFADINTRMLLAERRVAEAELGAARAELRLVMMMLEETVVEAPIEGIVGMRFVEVGEKAGRDTLLFTLFNTDTVYAQVEVAESDLIGLRAGQEADLRFEADLQQTVQGKIELIAPYINPKTRTARVRISLDNSRGDYIPGMFARVRIFTGEAKEQVTVPHQTVLTDPQALPAGNAVVYVVRNERAFRQEVVVGQRVGDSVVILEGLKEGEAVVLDSSLGLRDGTDVEVVP